MPRKFTLLFLMILVWVANDAWKYCGQEGSVNIFWLINYPLDIRWFWRFAGECAGDILQAIIMVLLVWPRYKILRIPFLVYLASTIVDAVYFMLNFNSERLFGFKLLYFVIIFFAVFHKPLKGSNQK